MRIGNASARDCGCTDATKQQGGSKAGGGEIRGRKIDGRRRTENGEEKHLSLKSNIQEAM